MTAIYARQSVDKKESISIESQIELCRREVLSGEEIKVYKDKGYSGKNTKRPAFTELMEDVKSGSVSKIIVYRLDRFSRSIADFGMIWQILERHNVEFISVNERFDTTSPIGVAMLNIIMTFAQLERQTIAERVTDNYYARAKIGSWTGGPAPYGFDIGKVTVNGKLSSALIPNDDIHIIVDIYDKYSMEGVTLGQTAKYLNEKGIKCVKRKAWDSVAVSRILHNPIYVKCDMQIYLYMEKMGVNIENDVEDFDGERAGMLTGKRSRSKEKYNSPNEQHFTIALHNGIVDSGTWLKCQEKLNKNTQIKNTGSGRNSWLTGLIKCGCCGYGIKVMRYSDRRYMVCSGRSNYRVCKESYAHISVDEIEAAVFGEIKTVCSGTDIEISQSQRDSIEDVLEIDHKIERLMEAISEGSALSIKYINKEIEKLDAQKSKLLRNSSAKKTAEVSSIKIDENMSSDEKSELAASLIERIELKNDEVNVIWRI